MIRIDLLPWTLHTGNTYIGTIDNHHWLIIAPTFYNATLQLMTFYTTPQCCWSVRSVHTPRLTWMKDQWSTYGLASDDLIAYIDAESVNVGANHCATTAILTDSSLLMPEDETWLTTYTRNQLNHAW